MPVSMDFRRRSVAFLNVAATILLVACGSPDPAGGPAEAVGEAAGAQSPRTEPEAGALPGPCPADATGLSCLFALHAEVATTCDPIRLDHLRASLTARRVAGTLPAWHQGRALFVTWDAPAQVAGTFNGWDAGTLATARLCDGELHTTIADVASGHHPYKLVSNGSWILDPANGAFAYDDFIGNADGRNSVLNTWDSGKGHLVRAADSICSEVLGDCRALTAYLPPGYGAPAAAARVYPTLFMHDGQNVFDDHDCCFGHTGWEVNVALDTEIAAGRVEEAIVVAFDHAGDDRWREYGVPESLGGDQEAFMDLQVNVVQVRAGELFRVDPERRFVIGSSLGGLISFRLALAYPDVYAGAGSLSGAFWPGEGTGSGFLDFLAEASDLSMPLYLDHGGTAAEGGDGYHDSVRVKEELLARGWSATCATPAAPGERTLCYVHEPGATHDELAWRRRAPLFLVYFLGK